ncbi:DUF1353 domain-containing protein [Vibrio sp. SCSIO 43136]|uniref:DUF1353 domain-containing protein n=1 Tax=Vibrio sp. SCSIO 43136 TaxID=2819101 RepID=UPI002076669C|nr:DUF1353 domain-containing protein [Vibrio sp. SCSIO 43136]USD66292.1 DUF1353 domain-containing protein [Vibrio sp. SCSIO 43136]
MDCFILGLGWLTAILLMFYGLIIASSYLLTLVEDDKDIEMPKLIPVRIQTKNQPTWLHKLVVFVTQTRKWQLAENWTYKLNDDVTLVIEKGFVFDGASIPRIFWAILSPTGLLLIPGLIHDYGYRYDQIWKLEENNQTSVYAKGKGRAYWDDLFKQVANEVNQVSLVNAFAKAAIARWGDGIWSEHRKANNKPNKPVFWFIKVAER